MWARAREGEDPVVCVSGTTAALRGPRRMGQTVLCTLRRVNGTKENKARTTLSTSEDVCTMERGLTSFFRTRDPAEVTFATGSARDLGVTLGNLFRPNSRIVAAMLRRGSMLHPLC